MDPHPHIQQQYWDHIWTSIIKKNSFRCSSSDLSEYLWDGNRWQELVPLIVRDLIRATRDEDEEAEWENLSSLAFVLGKLKLIDESCIIWKRSLCLSRKLGDPTEIQANLTCLAWHLVRSSDPAEAIPIYQECLEADEKLLDLDQSFYYLANLGALLGSVGQWHDALVCYERALPLAPDATWEQLGWARILQAISEANQELGENGRAIAIQREVVEYLHQRNELLAAAECSVRLGELLALAGRPADGRAVIMNAIMTLEALGEAKTAAWASYTLWDMD